MLLTKLACTTHIYIVTYYILLTIEIINIISYINPFLMKDLHAHNTCVPELTHACWHMYSSCHTCHGAHIVDT